MIEWADPFTAAAEHPVNGGCGRMSEGSAVSYVVFFEMYGYRPLAIADMHAVFGPGAQVDEGTPLEGGFRVGFGGRVFSIREGASPVSTAGFVREFARDKGMGEFTHVFAVEVDGEDFDGLEVEGDGSAVLIERFSALAGRMGGACAMLDMHMQAYDPAADRTYDLSAPAGGALPPAGPALVLTWHGVLGGALGEPVERFLELCAQRYPDLLPREFERDGRRLPLDDRVREYLVGPDFNEASAVLWNDSVLGAVSFSYPALRDPGARSSSSQGPAFFDVTCTVLLDTVGQKMGVEAFRDFFTAMSQELRAELAVCQVVNGYRSDGGLAQWAPGAAPTDIVRTDRNSGVVLGLPVVPVWWVWLGSGYAEVAGGFLASGAPSSWRVVPGGSGGVFVETSPSPVAYGKAERGGWFPKEFLPRKRLFGRGWEPARTRPQWGRA